MSNKKDYIKGMDENAERRYFSINPADIQIREEGESRTVEGVAAVVNSTTNLGIFEERIAPGAFDGRLNDDVVALFNHDPNYPLARTTARGEAKLDLFITKEGHLGYRFSAPKTTVGNDLIENIRSGVISKSSFAFTIEKDEWGKGEEADVRTIKKIKRLYDVSPVTYPAYNDTSVAERSLEQHHYPQKEFARDCAERDKDLRELDLLNLNLK